VTRATSGSGAWAPERRLLTAGLIGLVTAVAFEGMAVPTVLPATVRDLGGLDLYGWAFSAFWLTNIIGITLAGTDADRHGPARAFGAGVILFAIGMLISGLAPDMAVVIAGRAVQGFGSGAIGAVIYAAVARAYDPAAMPRMIALVSSAWVVPGLVGPALAGGVADGIGWRWVFAGLVPPVLLMGIAVLGPLRSLRPKVADADRPRADGRRGLEAVRLAIGSTLALGALSVGHPLVALVLGVAGAWLVVRALRHLLPRGALTARAGRAATVAVVFAVTFAFFGTEAFVPAAVTLVRGETTTIGGLALSGAAVSWTVGSWLQDRLAPRGWRRQLVGGGSLLIAAGIALAALVLLPGMPVAMAAIGWTVAGLGMGLAYSTLALLTLETAESGQEGQSSSALQLMFTLGTAFGAGIGGAVVALADAGLLALAAAIGVVDGIMLVVAIVGAALAGRIPTPRGTGERPAAETATAASPAGALAVRRDQP
jgi:MFS family permease